MSESLITPALAADVANAVTGDSLEAFVGELPAESVPVYLARLVDASTNIRALTKGLEQRLVADGQVGQHWTIDGVEYGFYGSLAKGWQNIPSLIDNLMLMGITAGSIAVAISEIRVTDLRTIVDTLPYADRVEALAIIEEHRTAKGERGAPRFQAINDKIAVKR